MANRTYFTVVVYDIVDNKRRARVAKSLLGYGERVQYSGFEAHLTSKQLVTLTSKIKEMIDEKEDRVRIYKIAGQPQVTVFGSIPLYEDEEFTII
ncbi:MAG TPA: CRISPR-associated endonuclease Cas2 [Candidatus Obscuribacterales bacterium]